MPCRDAQTVDLSGPVVDLLALGDGAVGITNEPEGGRLFVLKAVGPPLLLGTARQLVRQDERHAWLLRPTGGGQTLQLIDQDGHVSVDAGLPDLGLSLVGTVNSAPLMQGGEGPTARLLLWDVRGQRPGNPYRNARRLELLGVAGQDLVMATVERRSRLFRVHRDGTEDPVDVATSDQYLPPGVTGPAGSLAISVVHGSLARLLLVPADGRAGAVQLRTVASPTGHPVWADDDHLLVATQDSICLLGIKTPEVAPLCAPGVPNGISLAGLSSRHG